jgi:hypothetical protein
VARYFALLGVQPHRTKSFSLSPDPLFVDKARDIAGLYLNPPDKALVLCVDEKSQIQALERTQPATPMGLGYGEGVTHGYVRHGMAGRVGVRESPGVAGVRSQRARRCATPWAPRRQTARYRPPSSPGVVPGRS